MDYWSARSRNLQRSSSDHSVQPTASLSLQSSTSNPENAIGDADIIREFKRIGFFDEARKMLLKMYQESDEKKRFIAEACHFIEEEGPRRGWVAGPGGISVSTQRSMTEALDKTFFERIKAEILSPAFLESQEMKTFIRDRAIKALDRLKEERCPTPMSVPHTGPTAVESPETTAKHEHSKSSSKEGKLPNLDKGQGLAKSNSSPNGDENSHRQMPTPINSTNSDPIRDSAGIGSSPKRGEVGRNEPCSSSEKQDSFSNQFPAKCELVVEDNAGKRLEAPQNCDAPQTIPSLTTEGSVVETGSKDETLPADSSAKKRKESPSDDHSEASPETISLGKRRRLGNDAANAMDANKSRSSSPSILAHGLAPTSDEKTIGIPKITGKELGGHAEPSSVEEPPIEGAIRGGDSGPLRSGGKFSTFSEQDEATPKTGEVDDVSEEQDQPSRRPSKPKKRKEVFKSSYSRKSKARRQTAPARKKPESTNAGGVVGGTTIEDKEKMLLGESDEELSDVSAGSSSVDGHS
ncbi:hypothetical protein DFJ73DRAFT_850717 [Zopfochytrium polystomum]|nr:hypothetical protein DFJ73DRAFT_850717 [Zopfochytrium polystomum]